MRILSNGPTFSAGCGFLGDDNDLHGLQTRMLSACF